jgi:hypothetical protein
MRKLIRQVTITSVVFMTLVMIPAAGVAQPFNKPEFVERRARLFEKIGDGIAVVFAAKGQNYPVKFRQSPDFYYLTGIEEPGAVLVMLGPTKASFLFAPKRTEPQIRADGPGIWQIEKREEVYGLTRVQPVEEFLSLIAVLGPRAHDRHLNA